MKKNTCAFILLMVLVMSQFGFDWGASGDKEKKRMDQSAAAVSSKETSLPFPQMMAALTQNMTLWPALGAENKKRSVEAAILIFRDRQNSAIMRPADFYVEQIDLAIKANGELQATDIMSMVKMMSVMQYDFYNGQDKDALAKEVLGEQMYQNIRARRQK